METELIPPSTDSGFARQAAVIIAQKSDREIKNEFPIFWELLRLKIKETSETYGSNRYYG